MKYTVKVVQTERGITISDITIGYDLDATEALDKVTKVMSTHGLRGSAYQGDVVIQPQPQDIDTPPCEDDDEPVTRGVDYEVPEYVEGNRNPVWTPPGPALC